MKTKFGPKTDLGKRRTTFGEAPEHDEAAIEEAMVVREPITVVVSEKGWIRALRGHVSDLSGVAFKTDDALKFAFPTETTAKVLIFASNGTFYTSRPRKLPGGRGHGEPVRLYFDIEQDADVVAALAYQGGAQIPGGELWRQRLRGAGGRGARHHPQGQAGAQPEGHRQGGGDDHGRRRTGRRPSARTARW